MILVGGEGTRLRPLTYTVPKQMLPVVEVPMIERVLQNLAAHGIEDAVLSLGYRADPFLALYPDRRAGDVALTYAVEPQPLDTAGAVAFAARAAGIDDTFVATNGDVLTDLDVTALVEFHRRSGAEGTIALARVEDPSRFGLVQTDDHGRVLAFIEKPAPGVAAAAARSETHAVNTVNAGTYVLEASVLDRIPAGRRVSIEREVFPAMVAEGTLFAMASDAYWTDTGTPAQYLQAQLDLVSGLRPGPPVDGVERDDDGVWKADTAVVDGEVRGPAFVGAAAFVQSGATVEGSVISAGARVSSGAIVRNSVLLPGASVRADALVEDSLVGERAVVGEKAVLRGLTVVGEEATVEAGADLHGARVPVG